MIFCVGLGDNCFIKLVVVVRKGNIRVMFSMLNIIWVYVVCFVVYLLDIVVMIVVMYVLIFDLSMMFIVCVSLIMFLFIKFIKMLI